MTHCISQEVDYPSSRHVVAQNLRGLAGCDSHMTGREREEFSMHQCDECGAEYTSPLAAVLCGDDDREADQHARQELRGRARR